MNNIGYYGVLFRHSDSWYKAEFGGRLWNLDAFYSNLRTYTTEPILLLGVF